MVYPIWYFLMIYHYQNTMSGNYPNIPWINPKLPPSGTPGRSILRCHRPIQALTNMRHSHKIVHRYSTASAVLLLSS